MNRDLNGGVPGVVFSHGGYWIELRRFLLRNLRDFGFGKTSMEALFQEEVAKLCQHLSKKCDEPINLNGTMNISVLNALWSILVGENLDLEDPNLIKIVNLVNAVVNGPSPMNAVSLILPHESMATWPIVR
jgi:methyl farnesoate epoxidase/farnesoate epoxidase